MVAVRRLAIEFRGLQKLFFCDPALAEGDLFGGGDLDALAFFGHLNEGCGIQKAVDRSGIKPSKPATEDLYLCNKLSLRYYIMNPIDCFG